MKNILLIISLAFVMILLTPKSYAHGNFSGGFNTGLGFAIGQTVGNILSGPRFYGYYGYPPAAYYPTPIYPGYGYYGYGAPYGYGYIPPTPPGQVIIISPAAPPSNSMILGR